MLSRTSGNDLVLALKLADDALTRHLLRNMSAESARKVQAALDELGPVPVSRIEAAQREIANIARGLIERGEIYPLERRRPEAPTGGSA